MRETDTASRGDQMRDVWEGGVVTTGAINRRNVPSDATGTWRSASRAGVPHIIHPRCDGPTIAHARAGPVNLCASAMPRYAWPRRATPSTRTALSPVQPPPHYHPTNTTAWPHRACSISSARVLKMHVWQEAIQQPILPSRDCRYALRTRVRFRPRTPASSFPHENDCLRRALWPVGLCVSVLCDAALL